MTTTRVCIRDYSSAEADMDKRVVRVSCVEETLVTAGDTYITHLCVFNFSSESGVTVRTCAKSLL